MPPVLSLCALERFFFGMAVLIDVDSIMIEICPRDKNLNSGQSREVVFQIVLLVVHRLRSLPCL
jgi:hypothetical protein